MRAKSSWIRTWHLRHSHQRRLGLWPGEYGIQIVRSSKHHNRMPRHMQRHSLSSQWYYNITDWLMTINKLPNKVPSCSYLATVFPSFQEPSCIVICLNLCPLMLEMLWPLAPSKKIVKTTTVQEANMFQAKFWINPEAFKNMCYLSQPNRLRHESAMCEISAH